MEPGEADRDRRVVTVVHLAMLAVVPVYGGVLWLSGPARPRPHSGEPHLAWTLLAIGLGQYLAATLLGRKLLRSARGGARGRVRRYFLVRFAAAEAIAVFGLAAGFAGVPPRQALILFAAALCALLAAAPTRRAYAAALAQAGTG